MIQKSALLLCGAMLLHACLFSKKTTTHPHDLAALEWLVGNWNRVNNKPDRTARESWEKISAMEWKGLGVSLKNGVKTFEEQLKLVRDADGLYYEALVPENKSWVRFKLTEYSNHHFICENPTHDFPKKIAYTLKADGQLDVVISGDGKSQQFVFERAK